MTRRRVCRTRGAARKFRAPPFLRGQIRQAGARARRVIGRWQCAAQRRLEAHPAHYAVTNLILHARAKLAEAAAELVRAQLRIGHFGVFGSHWSRCFPRRTTSSPRPGGCQA
jgi:hypothetical protein